jgi:hypothetical protein
LGWRRPGMRFSETMLRCQKEALRSLYGGFFLTTTRRGPRCQWGSAGSGPVWKACARFRFEPSTATVAMLTCRDFRNEKYADFFDQQACVAAGGARSAKAGKASQKTPCSCAAGIRDWGSKRGRHTLGPRLQRLPCRLAACRDRSQDALHWHDSIESKGRQDP